MQPVGVKLYTITILALCALFASIPAYAVRTDMNVDTLRGIGGVHVIIQPLDKDLVSEGLAQDKIQAAVESRLRSAGIKILSEDELGDKNGAILFLSVDAVKGDGADVYACNISAELIQVASLVRSPDDPVPASTWTTGLVALVSKSNVGHLQDMTLAVVDQFTKDFQKANAAKTEVKQL